MAQADSLCPLITEARVRGRVSPCGICGEQSGFSPSSSVFLRPNNSSVALHFHISSRGWTIGPLETAVRRHSLKTTNMNNNYIATNKCRYTLYVFQSVPGILREKKNPTRVLQDPLLCTHSPSGNGPIRIVCNSHLRMRCYLWAGSSILWGTIIICDVSGSAGSCRKAVARGVRLKGWRLY
jgi:hypothetical protein